MRMFARYTATVHQTTATRTLQIPNPKYAPAADPTTTSAQPTQTQTAHRPRHHLRIAVPPSPPPLPTANPPPRYRPQNPLATPTTIRPSPAFPTAALLPTTTATVSTPHPLRTHSLATPSSARETPRLRSPYRCGHSRQLAKGASPDPRYPGRPTAHRRDGDCGLVCTGASLGDLPRRAGERWGFRLLRGSGVVERR